MTDLTIIITLSVIAGILALALWMTRQDLRATRQAWDRAIDLAEQAEERAAFYQKEHAELVARPVQAFIPQDAIEILAHHVIDYLAATEGPRQ